MRTRTVLKSCLSVVAMVLLVTLTAEVATAVGFGLTGEGGFGTAKLTSDHDGQPTVSADSGQYGVGLVFDSNVSGPDLFNLRLKLGVHFPRYTFTDVTYDAVSPPHSVELTGESIAFDLIPGLALWRSPKLRLWAGPQLRLSVTFTDYPYPVSDALGVGGGLALGINYSLSPRWSLTLEIGYRHGWYEVHYYPGYDADMEGYRMEDDRVFSSISLLFRSHGEAFEYQKKEILEQRQKEQK